MTELNRINHTSRAHDIANVGHRCAGSGTEVQHFAARAHVNCVETTEDTGRKLGAERVPDTIFSFCGGGSIGVVTVCDGVAVKGGFDAEALFTVGGFAGDEVLGDEEIFFAAGDEDTGVSVGFLVVGQL